jgi:hypothetical protein
MAAMPRPLPAALLLLTAAWSSTAVAARWFDLELVVFAREGAPGGNELWPDDPGLPNLDSVELHEPAPAGRQLGNVAAQLDGSPRYRVLLHRAWRQPTGSRARTPWVRLTDGLQANTEPVLDGMARLSVRRYLHLDLDLVIHRDLAIRAPAVTTGTVAIPLETTPQPTAVPATPTTAPATTTTWIRQPFRLIDSRRMRSGELHYVDHPAFGVLALATPYVPPEPEQPAAGPETPGEEAAIETPAATGTATPSTGQPARP